MRLFLFITLLFATSCSVTPRYKTLETYFASKNLNEPTLKALQHCHGYGCKYLQEISLSKKEWNTIKKPLLRKAKTPKIERKHLSESLKRFEKIVGHKTGTDADIADTFKKQGDFQLDCADESTNTTLYMKLLENEGLLKHHSVSPPKIRGAGNGIYWLHETAVIKDNDTDIEYAVDSWWKDNGEEPYIIPLEEWAHGWKPEKEESKDAH
ncbi:MAG: hypothetical protein AAF988_03340 [Pseudomonadota bacterium]